MIRDLFLIGLRRRQIIIINVIDMQMTADRAGMSLEGEFLIDVALMLIATCCWRW